MKKSFLLAILAYLVPTFITGFVWHLVAFHDTYTRLNIYRPDMLIPFGFGSMVVQGLIPKRDACRRVVRTAVLVVHHARCRSQASDDLGAGLRDD